MHILEHGLPALYSTVLQSLPHLAQGTLLRTQLKSKLSAATPCAGKRKRVMLDAGGPTREGEALQVALDEGLEWLIGLACVLRDYEKTSKEQLEMQRALAEKPERRDANQQALLRALRTARAAAEDHSGVVRVPVFSGPHFMQQHYQ